MGSLKCLIDGLNHEEFRIENHEAGYFDTRIVSMHYYFNLVFICKGMNNEGSNIVGRRPA